jgi:hypothetical protein
MSRLGSWGMSGRKMTCIPLYVSAARRLLPSNCP